jgi:ubiquinone/menaquinone biosynthesis C-methylase UbiE
MRAVIAGNVPDRRAFEDYYRAFHAEQEQATELVMATLHDEAGATTYDRLTEALARVHPRTVLDIGCGDGPLLERLVARVPDVRVSGIDLSEVEIGRANGRLPARNVGRLVQGNASDLPFDDASFDAVASHMVLMLVPEVTEVIAQARRVLKAGGVFASVIMRPPDELGEVTEILRAIPQWVREKYAGFAPVNPGDDRVWSVESLKIALRGAGFDDITIDDFTVSREVNVETLHPLIEKRYYLGSLPEDARNLVRERLVRWGAGRSLTYSEPMRLVLAR